MSYALIVSEVRRGVFEERNLDSIGLGALLGKETVLLAPEGAYEINEKLVDAVVKVKSAEDVYLNPMNMGRILEQVFGARGKPDYILFTQSSSGTEAAAYTAGLYGLPVITDVSAYDKEAGVFLKSYYSDKVFGQFKASGGPAVLTVRSGSFREFAGRRRRRQRPKPWKACPQSTAAHLWNTWKKRNRTSISPRRSSSSP